MVALISGSIIAQPIFTPFSTITSKRKYASSGNITKISDGFLIQGFSYEEDSFKSRMLFKISPSGKVLDSMFAIFDNKEFYSDQIIHRENLNYQLGYIFPSKSIISPKRGLIIFDDNLTIINKFEYDIVPANGFPNTNTSNIMVGDTIISVRNYSFFDSLLNPLPGKPNQIERFGINGEIYGVANISKRVSLLSDAVVVEDRIFIFGWIASVVPNFNPYPVGEYMLDGTFIKCHPYNVGAPPNPSFRSDMAENHKGLLYHVHQNEFGQTMLDQRDSRFKLLKRVKLKNEEFEGGFAPTYKSFAFDDKDNIFYLQTNKNTQDCSVFKLNSDLELLWEKNFGTASGDPNFVVETNEGGCLVGFVSSIFNAQGKIINILNMYKLDDLGNITSVKTIRQPTPSQSLFYPNPFRSQLTLQQGIESATQVCLYDMSGRTVGTYTLENNSINVADFLPIGTYMAQLKDAKSKILGVQTVVKE